SPSGELASALIANDTISDADITAWVLERRARNSSLLGVLYAERPAAALVLTATEGDSKVAGDKIAQAIRKAFERAESGDQACRDALHLLADAAVDDPGLHDTHPVQALVGRLDGAADRIARATSPRLICRAARAAIEHGNTAGIAWDQV